MNKMIYLAVATILCASCFHVNSNWKGNGKSVKGEGPVVTRTLDLAGFDAIMVKGHADIQFEQVPEGYEVTLRTQENVFDYLDYSVEGTTLQIQNKDQVQVRAEAFDLTIKAPALKKVQVDGAGDFDLPFGLETADDFVLCLNGAGDFSLNRIICPSLSIEVNGAGDIDAKDLKVRSLSVLVNGAGDVNVSGDASDADLRVNGAGDIDARELRVAGKVTKHAAGAARIRL